MTLLRQANLIEKAHIFFHIFNSDDSNLLDQTELKNFSNSIQILLQDEKIPIQYQKIYESLKKFDYNNDGFMNLKEFTDFFVQDNDILNFLKTLGVITQEDLQ